MNKRAKDHLHEQIQITKDALKPSSPVIRGLLEMTSLIEMFFNYLEKETDKHVNQKLRIKKKFDKKIDFKK